MTTALFATAALLIAAPVTTPAFAQSGKVQAGSDQPGKDPLLGTRTVNGLLPVHIDEAGGRVLVTLPAPGPGGLLGRYLYVTSLRTGIGSSQLGFDHGQVGDTHILAFRRIGGKVVAEYENPRFRAAGGTPAEQAAARDSFLTTTTWVGDIARTNPDGSVVVDLSKFLTRDAMGIAPSLKNAKAGDFKLSSEASLADAAATRAFPDNIELEARQTFTSDAPARIVEAIAPDGRAITLGVHHSLIRLPAPGYQPIPYDPRFGGFVQQVVDFGAPLGQNVVSGLAMRFRLEKTDPAAPRSRVKKPIVFYIDRAAPEPIRTALAQGVGWWKQAFDAAGYIDAFQVEILPENADPLDIRYNVVNWVNRATRGWSYGQAIADPRTGEIVKGSVLLGSLRTRQDMLIFEALVGAHRIGTGGPNDPVEAALARIRQLGAHEVGHSLGFEHNFAASTQDRASVMDYPAPRIGLKNGAPDLSDAYGVGVGAWDVATVRRLYGEPPPGTDADSWFGEQAVALKNSGLRFIADADARASSATHPWASLWDDGPDPAAELNRMIEVRRVALGNFGLGALKPGEAVESLRRKFVPIWLLHRYQIDAAAKLVGGVDFAYAVVGGGHEEATPVPPAHQRAALDALMATLSADTLRVPAGLPPMLSAGRSGARDQQFDIEVMETAGGPVFDPLVAADVGATLTLDALLDAERLQRLALQQMANPAALSATELLARLTRDVARASDPLSQRIATRTLLHIARLARDPQTPSGIAALADDVLLATGKALAAGATPWARSTARVLADNDRLTAAIAQLPQRTPRVPPGMPIGSSEDDWMGDLPTGM